MSTEEREISLIDLTYRVFLKWRFLLLWMVVGMAAMGLLGYRKYKTSLSVAEAVDEEVDIDETTKTLKAPLEDRESGDVEVAVDVAAGYYTLYKEHKSYMNDSLLMKLNPMSVSRIELKYEIDNHYQVEYPNIVERDNTDVIIEAYLAAIASSEIYDEISETLGEGIDAKYYKEVINAEAFSNGITIQLSHCDREHCEKMADIMKQAIERVYPDVVEACGDFDISIVAESYADCVDQELLGTQQRMVAQLNTLFTTMGNIPTSFSDEQQTYYNHLLYWETYGKEENEVENIGDIEEPEDADQATLSVSGNPINIKYILVGAAVGIFLAGCWIVLLYVIDSRLRTEEDLRCFGGLQNLGTIPIPSGKKRFLHVIDIWIEKWMYSNRNKLSYEESIQLAASYLEVLAAQNKYGKIFITGCRWNDGDKKIAMDLQKLLGSSGLSVQVMDNIILNGRVLKEASAADGVVLVEELGHTRYNELERELTICAANGLPVLGVVVGEPRVSLAK